MVMLKLLTLLLAYTLITGQMSGSHAAPSRATSESASDRATLTSPEARRLLGALVQRLLLVHPSEEEEEEREHLAAQQKSSGAAQKRACNTSTCVTHRLADFLSRSGGIGSSSFVPTNVGADAFGRRRR
ncbi:calcitonin/calcitonin-related polypeptide, alpha [Lampris incognitus]|uniref:calcitonin/calcitonin-related polypeptide, alpha n=1 Tax=Lampris incognitus TaxID=2546036 RepID=UPI0024B634F9|nr:calcitonin/calcitonin-related polypeptide, alpha [Lampris incognitus]